MLQYLYYKFKHGNEKSAHKIHRLPVVQDIVRCGRFWLKTAQFLRAVIGYQGMKFFRIAPWKFVKGGV